MRFIVPIILVLASHLASRAEAGGTEGSQRMHATGFSIEKRSGYQLLTISNAIPRQTTPHRYVLVEAGAPVPEVKDSMVIHTPVKRVVVLVGSYLAHLDVLGESQSVVAVGRVAHVYDPAIREKVKAAEMVEVGAADQPDAERIVELNPDVVLSYSQNPQGLAVRRKLQAAGIPVILSGSWLEQSPLGRAEWLKLTAALVGKEEMAAEWFSKLTVRYEALRDRARAQTPKPSVLVGAPFKGVWHVPGGRSFTSRLIEDAGGRYLWKSTPVVGSVPADIEAVLALGMNAQCWINPSDWKSLKDGRRRLSQAKTFAAYETGRIYNNNARLNEAGGNDVWESGFVHPDIVLKDLIWIFHPELVPDHEPVYYRKLK